MADDAVTLLKMLLRDRLKQIDRTAPGQASSGGELLDINPRFIPVVEDGCLVSNNLLARYISQMLGMMQQGQARQRCAEQQDFAVLLTELGQWRALTHSVLQRMIARQFIGESSDCGKRAVRVVAPSRSRPRA